MIFRRMRALCLAALFTLSAPGAEVSSDICVYGGTSGGVAAAVTTRGSENLSCSSRRTITSAA
jgi:hypothetical protein